MESEGEIISVDETVWSLRLGARDPPSNVARFEEIWVGKGNSKRKVTRPPFDDPSVFAKPAYMYREQEVEEHSEDEGYEGPSKIEAFDRPAFKRRVIKTRNIQWALEDRKDYASGGGVKYLGDKTVQTSKYATFKVDDQRSKTIEVTPVDEWWQFKKAPRDDGKLMSVKEAEELMKKQENFMGPLSLANKVLGKNSLEAAERSGGGGFGNLDREDTQVLHEAGVKLGGPDEGVGGSGGGYGSGSDGAFGGPEDEGDMGDADAGGEDDDFDDGVRSDDEEEVANDDVNEGGGTLHQDDEDLNDSDGGEYTDDDDEHQELQKLSRAVNADGGEDEDDYNGAADDPGRASPSLLPPAGNPADAGSKTDGVPGAGAGGDAGGGAGGKRGASAMRDDGGDGGGAGAGGSGSGGEGGGKRARKSQKKGALEINQENVVEALRIHGGRLASKLLLQHFVASLKIDGKKNKAGLATLRDILKRVATKVDDALLGVVWILKDHFGGT